MEWRGVEWKWGWIEVQAGRGKGALITPRVIHQVGNWRSRQTWSEQQELAGKSYEGMFGGADLCNPGSLPVQTDMHT